MGRCTVPRWAAISLTVVASNPGSRRPCHAASNPTPTTWIETASQIHPRGDFIGAPPRSMGATPMPPGLTASLGARVGSGMSRWAGLALVTLAHALGALAVLSVAPLAPFLLESLELTRAQVGLFLPAVYLGGVLMALPAGWLTDRMGVRATLGAGQVIIGVMVMGAAMTDSLPAFLG